MPAKDDEKIEEKMDVDEEEDALELTETIRAEVDKVKSTGQNLDDVLKELLNLEKRQRRAEKKDDVSFLCEQILTICHDGGTIEKVNEYLVIVTKRRGQFRKAQQRSIKTAMKWLDKLDEKKKISLIDAIREVTEGKVHVEVERARVTRILAGIREKEGKIQEAVDLIDDLHVETYGSMGMEEKCGFLLELMRLHLANKNFELGEVARNKISGNALEQFKKLREQFFQLSIVYFRNSDSWLEMSQIYQKYFSLVANDTENEYAMTPEQLTQCCLITALCAPYGKDQVNITQELQRFSTEGANMNRILVEKCPQYKKILDLMTTDLLAEWDIFRGLLEQLDVANFDFGVKTEKDSSVLIETLHQRVVEHNICQVVAKFYTQITLERLAVFTGLTADAVEGKLRDLVWNGMLDYAKIDGIKQLVVFKSAPTSTSVVNDWRQDIEKLLGLVNTTCHQINMVHKAKGKSS